MEAELSRDQGEEIDLIEAALIVKRHYKVFLAAFLATFIAGTVLAVLRQPYYDYSVAIEIGGNSLTTESGGIRTEGAFSTEGAFKLVAKPEDVESVLQNLIPTVLVEYAAKYPEAGLDATKIQVTIPNESQIVLVNMRGTLAKSDLYISMLNDIVTKLASIHGALLKQRADLTRSVLTDEVRRLESDIGKLEESRKQVMIRGSDAGKALTLLLMDGQIATQNQQLFTLQEQLQIDLNTGIKYTHAVIPPQRSPLPVGLDLSARLAITFIFSILIGLIAVFCAHFIAFVGKRNRSRSEA